MTDVPAPTPVITPVEASTVALAGVPLDHIPPEVELAKVVVEPRHTVAVPVMAAGAAGKALTVTVLVAVLIQPLPLVTV